MFRYVLDGHEPRREDDLLEWTRWYEAADRRVARTTLLDGSVVSTVFLGLDHNGGEGPPLLFETCVFIHPDTDPPESNPFFSGRPLCKSEVQQRYSTWAEAEVGHMEIVEDLTAQLKFAKEPTR